MQESLGAGQRPGFLVSIPESQKKSVLPRIQPMRLRLIKQAFDDPEYLFDGQPVVIALKPSKK